jgi:hypothetical protein
MSTSWERLSRAKQRDLHDAAKTLVSGSIIEDAAARFLAMVICEAAANARNAERGKWLDAISEYFDGPTAEAVRAYAEDGGTKMEMNDDT